MQPSMSHNSSLDEQSLHTDAFEAIFSGNNLLVDWFFFAICQMNKYPLSTFYFNSKATYHLFVTRQEPNKMHHSEIYFQVWTIWIKFEPISF